MNKLEAQKLAEWFDLFNSWEYPEDFLFEKPKDWEELPRWDNKDKTTRTKYTVSKPYMEKIREIIGEKECMRFHNLNNLKVKNYQFEIWWFIHEHINPFILKYINNNFYLDIYTIMVWRNQ